MSGSPPASDRKALHQVIVHAFPTWAEFDRFLDYDVNGRSLERIAGRGPMDEVVRTTLQRAVAEGWFVELEDAVLRERPNNAEALAYVSSRRKVVSAPSAGAVDPQLEQIVRKDLAFQDVRDWTAGLLRAQNSVCRVDLDGAPSGTGFLVGRDLVLTNHHVVARAIEANDGTRVSVRFDLHTTAALAKPPRALGADWLVAASPHSPLDTTPRTARAGAEPDATTLDFALLRLAGPIGDEEVDGKLRGFLQSDVRPDAYTPDAPIVILQHPQGGTQKLAVDTKGIVEVNTARTRFRYRTNTEPGSSGSPCFDLGWRLVGLHHSGEPGYQQGGFNEGIPIETLFANLPATARAALAASRAVASPRPAVERADVPNPSSGTASPGVPSNRELRATLAAVFSSAPRIRMLLSDAGVKTTRVPFEQSAEVIWDAALVEARDAGKLADVLAIACEEYPSHRVLADLARRARG